MASSTARAKKSNQDREGRARLERRALELSKECPLDRGNPPDCPLFALRPFSAPERRKWIRRLSDMELEYLGSYHSCCLTDKVTNPRR
jgi:hypothetical protein